MGGPCEILRAEARVDLPRDADVFVPEILRDHLHSGRMLYALASQQYGNGFFGSPVIYGRIVFGGRNAKRQTHAKTIGGNRLVSFGRRVRDAPAGGRNDNGRRWRCYCGWTGWCRGRRSRGSNCGRARRPTITSTRPLLRQGPLWPHSVLPPQPASSASLLMRRRKLPVLGPPASS